MASQAYEQILTIQALDVSITQLRHRRDNHPARSLIADVDARLATHGEAVDAVGATKHELERQQKRLEDEVAMIEEKRRDIDGKLYGGSVTGSKELLALQDEATSLLSRQTELEDEDLAIMEQLEEVDSELGRLGGERQAMERERADQEAELEAAVTELDRELGAVEAERAAAAGPASPELLSRYEELRAGFDGVPVARLVAGRCDGCHIQLSAVAVDQMARMADDAVVTCEECGRLLVR